MNLHVPCDSLKQSVHETLNNLSRQFYVSFGKNKPFKAKQGEKFITFLSLVPMHAQ